MVLGMSVEAFTVLHVIISLVAILSGFVVLLGLLGSQQAKSWTGVFLLFTFLTSATGFLFPFTQFLPSHLFGIISIVLLAITVPAIYQFHLAGFWRPVYVIGTVILLYLNVFVLVVQGFLKVPFLNALAPTQDHPVFAVSQLLVLVMFAWLGFKAVRKFHPHLPRSASV
ncbi:MAG TPA: hypothetical protein VFG52_09270 [Xanthomonadales bacterium]|nr:hypothetical protein [Xanthomonadales bacterium]